MSSGYPRAVALLFLLAVACCFSAEASLTRKKQDHVSQDSSLRGSTNKAEQTSNNESEDDDDDDDDDDDEAPANATKKAEAAKSSSQLAKEEDKLEKQLNPHAAEELRLKKAVVIAKQELNINRQEQLELKIRLKHLSNEALSSEEIDASTKLVANETESPAMGNMLGHMWKEMRMFEMPFYAEHTQEEIHHLKRDERVLEAKMKAKQSQLSAAQKRWQSAAKKEEAGVAQEKIKSKDEEEKDEADGQEKSTEETEEKKPEALPLTETGKGVKKGARPAAWSFWSMSRKGQEQTLKSSLVYIIFGILFAFIYKKCTSRFPKHFTPQSRPDVYANQKEFSFSLFGCISDPKIMLAGCCCPAMRWAHTLDQTSLMSYWKAFSAFFCLLLLHTYSWGISSLVLVIVGVFYRQKLRRSYQIESGTASSVATDLLSWVCCTPCAIVQEAREMVVQRPVV